jgi:hypothetical protein
LLDTQVALTDFHGKGMNTPENQNGQLKDTEFFKIANSQFVFVKISWIGPWVSRLDCCKGH